MVWNARAYVQICACMFLLYKCTHARARIFNAYICIHTRARTHASHPNTFKASWSSALVHAWFHVNMHVCAQLHTWHLERTV